MLFILFSLESLRIPGRPDLPVIRQLFTGSPDSVKVEIEYRERKLSSPPPNFPFPVTKDGRVIRWYVPPLSGIFPDTAYRIKKLGKIRGEDLYLLEIYTHRYDPGRNILLEPEYLDYSIPPLKLPSFGNTVLFVLPRSYWNTLKRLFIWRYAQGFDVDTLFLEDVSYDTAVLHERIKEKNPGFLVLVGDVDRIPAYSRYAVWDYVYTDLYYSCVDGDWIPDMYCGRISVPDTFTLKNYIDKVIIYDTTGTNWRRNAYFLATDDPSFHLLAESTHLYCMKISRERGFVCDSLFAYYPSGTPIDTALKYGRGWVVYSGHGSSSGWGGPSYSTSDVYELPRNKLLFFVLSFACYTGLYENSECFMEAWTRVKEKGGILSFGSSASSLWYEDDAFQRKIFDAVMKDGKDVAGDIIWEGKIRFMEVWGDTATEHQYFEQYNLFGDPCQRLFLDPPGRIVFELPWFLPDTTDTFILTYRAYPSIPESLFYTLVVDSFVIRRKTYSDTLVLVFPHQRGERFELILYSPGYLTWYGKGFIFPPIPYPVVRKVFYLPPDTLAFLLENVGVKTTYLLQVNLSSPGISFTPSSFEIPSLSPGDKTLLKCVSDVIFRWGASENRFILTTSPETLNIFFSMEDTGYKWEDTVETVLTDTLKFIPLSQQVEYPGVSHLRFLLTLHGNVPFDPGEISLLAQDKFMVLDKGEKPGKLVPGEGCELWWVVKDTSRYIYPGMLVNFNLFASSIPDTFLSFNFFTSRKERKSSVSTGILSNTLSLSFLVETGTVTWEIYDVSGRKVIFSEETTPGGMFTKIIKLNLPPGVYFLRLLNNKKECEMEKFIILK
ncbi:hypothetical protein DRQ20_06990 [bacterium]|nr:MAG: hypothetical protein DRQ20_06990 [bacterium]